MESNRSQSIGTATMERTSNENGVVIIGGGLAGLAAATCLARAGRKVTLFEKSTHLGGRAVSNERDGFIFNLGAHAIYKNSPALKVLNELGVSFTGGSPEGVRCVSKGHTYVAPIDPASMLRSELLDLPAKWEITRLLLKLQLTDAASYAGVTLSEWLDRTVQRVEVRRLLEASANVATYSNAPQQLSLGLFIEQLKLAARGVLYVDGGWQTLVIGLADAARKAGASLLAGTSVVQIMCDAGQVSGVRLSDGTFHAAQYTLAAIEPRELIKLLPNADLPALRTFVERAVPVQAACLDLALKRLPVPENKVVMSADHPLFLTVQSEFSKVAPEGKTLLYALKYLNPDQQQDSKADERELEGWLDLAQPGWRSEIIERRFMPHLTVSNALPSAAHGGLPGRPGTRVEGVANLFVAGDWVGLEGHLANASLSSAALAAKQILANAGASVTRRKVA